MYIWHLLRPLPGDVAGAGDGGDQVERSDVGGGHLVYERVEALLSLRLQLARGDDGRGRLIVADNGVGFDPSLPAKGIGQKLIKAFAGQLGGVVETTSGGTGSRFAMAFPLAK